MSELQLSSTEMTDMHDYVIDLHLSEGPGRLPMHLKKRCKCEHEVFMPANGAFIAQRMMLPEMATVLISRMSVLAYTRECLPS